MLFNIPADPRNPQRINHCPKCHTPGTDLFHGLWMCDTVQNYWKQVRTYIGRAQFSCLQPILFHSFRLEGNEEEDEMSGVPTLVHTVRPSATIRQLPRAPAFEGSTEAL